MKLGNESGKHRGFERLCVLFPVRLRKPAPVLSDASMNENGKTAGGMSAFKDGRSDLILFFERLIAWMLDGKMPGAAFLLARILALFSSLTEAETAAMEAYNVAEKARLVKEAIDKERRAAKRDEMPTSAEVDTVVQGWTAQLYTSTCLSPLTLLTPVHWGKPLHLIGLTSEVSVVGAPVSLTMGYHYGPSADLLYPVCVCVQNPSWNAVTCPIEDTL